MRVALPESSPGGARRQLRASLVARRRSVPARERQRASLLVARTVAGALPLRSHWRIAVYAALPDELDTAPLIALAQERGCRLYLPRIDRRRASRAMRFVEMRGPLRPNRLGIGEPATAATIGARWLDVGFLPLVGFDRRGVRLGTGGGHFYPPVALPGWRRARYAPRLGGPAHCFPQLGDTTGAGPDVVVGVLGAPEGA